MDANALPAELSDIFHDPRNLQLTCPTGKIVVHSAQHLLTHSSSVGNKEI